MIGKLRGLVDSVQEDRMILDVNGVGYLVFASSRVLGELQDTRGEVALAIETHVREDHIHLYGFLSEEERGWFTLLMTVQGVGAKMALALLSALDAQEIADAIAVQDMTTLTRANGVGKKLAERIVLELKTKVPTFPATAIPIGLASGKAAKKTAVSASIREDAISALINLGYARMDAFHAVVAALKENPQISLDDIIRSSLKELVA